MATKKTYSANKNASKGSLLRATTELDKRIKEHEIKGAIIQKKMKVAVKKLNLFLKKSK
jgi:hypothetical protein